MRCPRRLATVVAVMGGVTAAVLAGVAPAAHAAPMVIGGSQGHPLAGIAVALETPDKYCTGGLWKSRIVITAAHCINGDGRGAPGAAPGSIDVYAPAADRNSGPAPVRVLDIIYDPAWSETKDDIAFLILDSPLAAPIITRMATPAEVAALANAHAAVVYIGYGLTGPRDASSSVVSDQALAVTEPLRPSYSGDGKGSFETSGNGVVGTCAGDSGGPWIAQVGGEVLYLGPLSGGSGQPCDPPESPENTFEEAAVASAQTDLVSRALAAAGESIDGQARACLKGRGIKATCVAGRAWTYTSCRAGKKAVLQQLVDGKWTQVAKVTAQRSSACQGRSPYGVTFQRTDAAGLHEYRVVIPKQPGVGRPTAERFSTSVS